MDDLPGDFAPASPSKPSTYTHARPKAPAAIPSADWLSFDTPIEASALQSPSQRLPGLSRKPASTDLLQHSGPLHLPRKLQRAAGTASADRDLLDGPNLLRAPRSPSYVQDKGMAKDAPRSSRAAWHKHQGEGALTLRQRLSQQSPVTAQKVVPRRSELARGSKTDAVGKGAVNKDQDQDEDDEFGEFVATPVEPPVQQAQQELDLLDLDAAPVSRGPAVQSRLEARALATPLRPPKEDQEQDLLAFDSPVPQKIPEVAQTEREQEVEDADDDDFGDFVATPEINQEPFGETSSMTRPPTSAMLSHLLQQVLVVPNAFLKALAPLSFPMRQKVLHNDKTKAWIRTMHEAGLLCQRLISGRHDTMKSMEEQEKETALVRQVVAAWSALLPRLSSLSVEHGMAFKSLRDADGAEYSDKGSAKRCLICLTESELDHASCRALEDAVR